MTRIENIRIYSVTHHSWNINIFWTWPGTSDVIYRNQGNIDSLTTRMCSINEMCLNFLAVKPESKYAIWRNSHNRRWIRYKRLDGWFSWFVSISLTLTENCHRERVVWLVSTEWLAVERKVIYHHNIRVTETIEGDNRDIQEFLSPMASFTNMV